MPWADKLYGCDARWWDQYNGTDFEGEKWSTHGDANASNDKRPQAEKYGLKLLQGRREDGFSLDPGVIHYGDCSGFQAINLAILTGSTYIVLVGFNMGGKGHFFGDHPQPLFNQDDYAQWVPHFDKAAEMLPDYIKIINATPDTSLHSFPEKSLDEAIGDYCLYWHRPVTNAGAS